MTQSTRARSEAQDAVRGHGWLVAFWAVVVGFAAVTLAGSVWTGVAIRDPGGFWFVRRLVVSAGLFVVLALLDAFLRTAHGDRGLRGTAATLRRRWPYGRLVLAGTGLVGYHVVYTCYHNLKTWVALQQPRDEVLAGWDRWLFLGHDPADLLHDLLGVHTSAYLLVAVYESFTAVVRVAVVAAVVLPTRMRDGYVFLASALWVWILGVGSYYLVPSLGPFHSDPGRFADLPHTVVQDTQTRFMAERADFLADPGAAGGLSQVSAFASLHVAVTCLLLLMARYYGLRVIGRLLALFLLGTALATVYVGWHFAVDVLAGVVIAVVSVALGRRMVEDGRSGAPGP